MTPRSRQGQALLWFALDNGCAQFLSFACFLILARLLTPAEYGIFALAGSLTSGVFFVLQSVGPPLMQREELDTEHLSTAFWSNVLIGLAFTGLLWLTADDVGRTLGNPGLGPVLRWMSPTCVLMAVVSVPMAVLQRRLDVAAFVVRTLLGYVAGGAVSIFLALRGWGAVGLAIGQIVQWTVVAGVIFSATRSVPKFSLSLRAYTELASYSIHVISASVVTFATPRMQLLLVGALLDPTSVGYIAVAIRLVETIRAVVMGPVGWLSLPVLSPLQKSEHRFDEVFRSLVVAASSVWVPVVTAVGVTAPVVVPIVFGRQWSGSAGIIQAMCFGSVLDPINAFAGAALYAKGRPGIFNGLTIMSLVITIIAVSIAARWGAIAVSWTTLVVAGLMLPASVIVLRNAAQVHVLRLIATVLRVLGCAFAMCASMFLIHDFARNDGIMWLAATMVGGSFIYFLMLEHLMIPGYVSQMVRRARDSIPLFG